MDSVIGKIIRGTRLQDTAYIPDIIEWIGEAMDMLETRQATVGVIEPLMIRFHKAKLTCGLLYIDAVEWRGRRIPRGNSVRNIRAPQPSRQEVLPNTIEHTWTSIPFKYPAPGDQTYLYFSTLQKVGALPEDHHAYYEIELGTILTSFPDGRITLFTRQVATDDKGMPLIPDNANYKEALYWYVLGKLIGSGFDYRLVDMRYCDERFEHFAGRALAEITYPSPDEMEHRVNVYRRLIPPEHYFERYFRVDEGEGMYDPMGPFPGGGNLGPSDTYYV